jgi:hypothetical protein
MRDTAQPSPGSDGDGPGAGAGTPRRRRWAACGGGRTAPGEAPARTAGAAGSSSRTAGNTAAGWS